MAFAQFPEVNIKIEGMNGVKIPRMVRVKQIYNEGRIEDIKACIESKMDENLPEHGSYRGKRICVTAGSRGIPDIDLIIRTVVDKLKEWGADPFIIPAMGSHGGGTAEGQKEYLAGFNITEESMGVPILSSMDVVLLGELDDGTPVYCDKYAYESDGIVVLNKVKPHTDFRGPHESGLAKMMAIGIAKHKGAAEFHKRGFARFAEGIPAAAKAFCEKAPVAFGIGVVQNAFDEICEIDVMEASKILERDRELLKLAKERIATFKMHDIDVLIIDEIGKNISGNGHDPNVTGRGNSPGFEDVLNLKKMVVLGLTKETHHNACGICEADLTTRRVVNDIDLETTWTNVYNVNLLHGGRIPVYANTDRDAILQAIRTTINIAPEDMKIVHIKNTLSMSEIEVSESMLDFVNNCSEMGVLSEAFELKFDEEGFLISNL